MNRVLTSLIALVVALICLTGFLFSCDHDAANGLCRSLFLSGLAGSLVSAWLALTGGPIVRPRQG